MNRNWARFLEVQHRITGATHFRIEYDDTEPIPVQTRDIEFRPISCLYVFNANDRTKPERWRRLTDREFNQYMAARKLPRLIAQMQP